jgi:hypothetical protein
MFTFSPTTKIINVNAGVTAFTAKELYSYWKEWLLVGDNSKWIQAMSTVGGEEIGGGQSIAPYYFVINGWKVRPQEASHTLTVSGNLLGEGGGSPYVSTIGNYNVSVVTIVTANAIAVPTGGAGSGATAAEVWSYGNRVLTGTVTINPTQEGKLDAAKTDAEKARKLLQNRQYTNPTTGKLEVYNDADNAIEQEANIYKDDGTTLWDGDGPIVRRNKLQ